MSLHLPGSDESYAYMKGAFYLEISSSGKFRIVVEEKIPSE